MKKQQPADACQDAAAAMPYPPLLVDALRALSERGIARAILCVVFPLAAEQVRALLADERVVGLVLRDALPELVAEYPGRLQAYAPPERIERLPGRRGDVVVYVGLTRLMFYGLLTAGLRCGNFSALVPRGGSWRRRSTAVLLADLHLYIITGNWWTAIARRIGWRTVDRLSWRSRALRALVRVMPRETQLRTRISNLPAGKLSDAAGIVFYTGSLDGGGAERQMINTILGLKARGIGPLRVLCALSDDGFYRPVLERAGIAVELAGCNDAADIDPLLVDIDTRMAGVLDTLPPEIVRDALAMREQLRRHSPKVLHAWQDHCNVLGGVAALLAGVERVVLSTRSLAPYHFAFFQIGQHASYSALQAMPQVTIINNSDAGARDYADWLGLPRGSIKVVRNGVDSGTLVRPEPAAVDAFRASLNIPRSAPVVGTIATLYAVKRPLLWLKAARRLARMVPDAHFLIVGDGAMRPLIERRIVAFGLASRVHLVGRCNDVALPLAAMNAFLLTSRFEGLPNVLLEAQMMGVPVVTVAAGGAPETVNDGVTGIVVWRGTALKLAGAVARVLRDPAWRDRSATVSRAFVESRFGQSRMIDETLAVYGVVGRADGLSPAWPGCPAVAPIGTISH